MGNGKINVQINYTALNGKLDKAVTLAQTWLDNEVIADSSPYMPFMTGDLSKSARIVEAGTIEYNSPYARKMYYGEHFNFNKTHNQLAGAYWFERAKGVNNKKWINGVNQIMRGEI